MCEDKYVCVSKLCVRISVCVCVRISCVCVSKLCVCEQVVFERVVRGSCV